MTARWRLVGPDGRVPDIVAGHDFMTPGFERHLSLWVDPKSTDLTAAAATRLCDVSATSGRGGPA
jgi:hypothetical protein